MSITVTDEMVVAAKKAFTTTPGAWLDESTRPDDFSDAIRAALAAALAAAPNEDRVGALGAIYEIREATGVGAKPMLSELAEAITAKRDDAIRAAVLAEREACAKAVEGLRKADIDPLGLNSFSENGAVKMATLAIRSRPAPSEAP